LSPTLAPSPVPTIFWDNSTALQLPLSNSTSIFLDITGLCQGCSMDMGLFDQISTRRRRQLQEGINSSLTNDDVEVIESSNATNNNSEQSCFCPPKSKRIEISDEALVTALSELSFVNGTVKLSEVELVDCSVEMNLFETTVPLDFLVNGNLVQGDGDYIANGFMSTYQQLSDTYCDSLFRHPETVVSTTSQVLSGPDASGISKVRFLLVLQGTCRGCTGSESLFLNGSSRRGRRRQMQQQPQEQVCYCPKNAVPRAPTDQEFQDAFSKYLGSRRRRHLQQQQQRQGKFTLLCVGSSCSVDDTNVPSLSPTTTILVELVNPAGIQNHAGCVVPNSGFIGDGYCDRSLDVNGVPIYNSAVCGYDGGDW